MRQRRVKMMIVMHQLRQVAVKLPGTCQTAGCCIHHTLQFVDGDDLYIAAPVRTTLHLH